MGDPLDDDLSLAFQMADEADAIALSRFRALDLIIDTKPDLTPVSDADRAVEEALRQSLERERPDDEVLGEEFGTTGQSSRRWILDPIDGTKNYVRGVPVWATLIALSIRGAPQAQAADDDLVLGLVSAPALGMRWWATRDGGAWAGRGRDQARPISTSQVAAVDDASLSYSDWHDPAWRTTGYREGFQTMLELAWRTRAYGDFWSHLLVAEGAVDIAIEPELYPWDIAALIPIVREAGGRITALDGSPAMTGGNAVSTNGVLHDQVLGLLSGDRSSSSPLPD